MQRMKQRGFAAAIACLVFGSVATLGACTDPAPGRTFFERTIQPILMQKCAGNTSGCHSINVGDPFAIAAGNLDVTSYESITKRRDVLSRFGAYPYPLLLIKAVGDKKLKLQYGDAFRDIDVQHSGGRILDVGSDAYFTLQTWLDNGATENGLKPPTPAQVGNGMCGTAIPPGFDAAAARAQPGYAGFVASVQPVITESGCAAGNCHGAPQSDLYFTCGDTDDQKAFNFSQAWAFVNDPVEDSPILRVPLAVSAGGRGHTGGDQFPSVDSAKYVAVRTWAAAVGKLDFAAGDPARKFFADYVEPVLLQRGCAFQACHAPQAANDFKLRSGTVGFVSAVALEKNYDLLKNEFMAVEFPDARRGRAVAKTILADDPRVPGAAGIVHRGGPVLETPGTGPAEPGGCPTTFNAATATAFCTVQAWLDRERAQLLAAGTVTPMAAGDAVNVVYVERAAGTATAGRLDVDAYAGGADLKVVAFTLGAGQQLQPASAAAGTSLVGGCGLGASPDIQAPDVANDGRRVAFAARSSATDPLGVYVVNVDGTGCQRITAAAPEVSGVKIHNFDPAWTPDGQFLVFASTRGKAGTGPTRSRKRFLPQSDLWRVKMAGLTADAASTEQMTFLSNSEIGPQFMREGRMTMTTEKASDGFYQLSGRRLNWDLTDYHPLLGQRAESKFADPADPNATKPSIGYAAVTDIREASDGDFLVVLSDVNADGSPALPGAAGALGVFNRSIGPFEMGRVQDGYVPSLRIIDGVSASGRAGASTGYRSPASLPDGTIMVAYASNVAQGNFDLVSIDPRTELRRSLFTNGGGKIRLDAVLAIKYPARTLYRNRRQLVFGGSADLGDAGHAVLHMPDAPMVFTLLLANLRRGRPVDDLRAARSLAVYTESLCPAGACGANANGIFQTRTLLGRAKLASDGSVRVRLPANEGLIFELEDGDNKPLATMGEEHQLGGNEQVSMGVSQPLFNAVCGGCHGSVSGKELDVAVTPDALTGASASISATVAPTAVGP